MIIPIPPTANNQRSAFLSQIPTFLSSGASGSPQIAPPRQSGISSTYFGQASASPLRKNIHYVSSDSRRKTHYALPEKEEEREKEDRLAHSNVIRRDFVKKKKGVRARSHIFLNLYPVWENASPKQSACVNRGRKGIGDLDNWTEKGILFGPDSPFVRGVPPVPSGGAKRSISLKEEEEERSSERGGGGLKHRKRNLGCQKVPIK